MLDGRFAESATLAAEARDIAQVGGSRRALRSWPTRCARWASISRGRASLDQGLALLQASAAGRAPGGSPR